MKQWIRAMWWKERGQMLLLMVLLITGLLGVIGLSVDAGFAYGQRRQAQNGADNAALAAARVLFENGTTAEATAAAQSYAAANGYGSAHVDEDDVCEDNDDDCITVNIPPLTGNHVGDPYFVEVTVEEQPTTFVIHIVVPGGSTVRARGVAGSVPFPEPYVMVVLGEHDCDSFLQEGGASIAITGGGVMVNSDCQPNALTKTGTGDLIVEGSVDVHGGYEVSGSGTVSPDPRSVPWTADDPLAGLSPPSLGDPAPGSPGTAADPETWQHSPPVDLTLSPGTYYGGILADCVCTITLQPGVYVMAGGGFTKAGGANFVGDGVMIYVTENPANPVGDGAPKPFNLSGSGALDLSPPTSGLYEGITLWQDEAITDDFSLTGSNDLISGIFYAPGATLAISGNSEFGTVQLIADGFHLAGNAPLILEYGEFREFEAPEVVLVE